MNKRKVEYLNIAGIKVLVFLIMLFSIQLTLKSQDDSVYTLINGRKYSPFHTYRATATRINDLVNTRLSVRFDYDKSWLYGKEWVTLQPHFYPTDSLTLDAKGMKINQVALVEGKVLKPLKYEYNDQRKIHIHLGKTYRKGEQYTLFIDYISRPNELQASGNKVFLQNKGLYFINPKGTDPDKPTQIWTQGETEYSSIWFPTIDHPDQKSTEEIDLTVPDKYVTLSNGILTSQKKNGDGTRTDIWKLDKPNAPYLFMLAVGNFKIIHDHWKNIPVDYYVEPSYAPYAREIFGHTPEMIGFYSKILGVDFPWPKYDQIVVRDYVSGAMENTTATLHGEFVEQNHRELMDGNKDWVICHELFHQWFGDYVTTESWSNITLNESMADYAEVLWCEHKYGKDRAAELNYNSLMRYFQLPAREDHDLVDFYYDNPEDVFDLVSYQKGGRILNMLRNYVGDSAFFASLHEYLVKYAYGCAEAQQLRLAFEDVTGRDLSWFWDQWYYGKGYPKLDISYIYNDSSAVAKVFLQQTQTSPRIFRLPMAIDVYFGNKKNRIQYCMDAQRDTLRIPYDQGKRPDLIDVDADKILLAKITDHETLDNYIFQYSHAGTYLNRRRAIVAAARHQDEKKAVDFLIRALNDPFGGLRMLTIDSLDTKNKKIKKEAIPLLEKMAQNDPKTLVRAEALKKLSSLKQKKYEGIFLKALGDSSYSVESAGLHGIYELDAKQGLELAKQFLQDNKGSLTVEMAKMFADNGGSEYADFYNPLFTNPYIGRAIREYYIQYLIKNDDPATIRQAMNIIRVRILSDISPTMLKFFVTGLQQVKASKSGQKDLQDYIQQTIDALQSGMDHVKK